MEDAFHFSRKEEVCPESTLSSGLGYGFSEATNFRGCYRVEKMREPRAGFGLAVSIFVPSLTKGRKKSGTKVAVWNGGFFVKSIISFSRRTGRRLVPGRRFLDDRKIRRCTMHERNERGEKGVKQGRGKKEDKKERTSAIELCTVNASRDVSPKATEPLILIIGYSLPLLVPEAYLSAEPTCIAMYSRTCPLPFFFPFSSTHLG